MIKNLDKITAIIIIALILVYFLKYRENLEGQVFSTDERDKFLTEISNFNQQEPLDESKIKIKKIKDKIIVENYTKTTLLTNFLFSRNFKVLNKLEYQLKPLEHINNLPSGHIISHNLNTNLDNHKYGFVLVFQPTSQNGEAEISLDFTANQQNNLNNILDIDKTIKQISYQNLPRKTIHLFTKYNCPPDLLPYFQKGEDGKDIKLIGRFLDQTNLDFLKNLPNKKFNILDSNKNPVATNCTLDTPFCGVHITPKGEIKGRDNYIVGKFNHSIKEYTVLDTPKYTEYKKIREQKNKEDAQKLRELELDEIIKSKPSWDMLSSSKIDSLREFRTSYYKTISESKIQELKNSKKLLTDLTPEEMALVVELKEEDNFKTKETISRFTNIFEEVNSRYQNMEEHFSNIVEHFPDKKYKEYTDIKNCKNKENTEVHIKHFHNKNYSVIYPDNLLLQNKKDSIQKIEELSGFKCRKHYSPSVSDYYYGGIDYDGRTKCYGSNMQCELFKEQECLDLEKSLLKTDATKAIDNKKKKVTKDIQEIKESELRNDRQKTISDKLRQMKKIVEFEPYDQTQAGYIGEELETDYQKYNFLNCITNISEDVTCKHIHKKKNYDFETKKEKLISQTMVDIITFTHGNELNLENIISRNKHVEFNPELKTNITDTEKKTIRMEEVDVVTNSEEVQIIENIELQKPIDYLIEPCYDEFSSINPNIIYDFLIYKFKIVNIDHKYHIEVLKNNKRKSYILDNNNNRFELRKEDKIYIYLDRDSNLNLEVISKKGNSKKETFKLKGKFGDNINLYLKTNNTNLFNKIEYAELLNQIVYPYNPFVKVKIE